MPGFCVGYDDGRVDFVAFNPKYGGAGSASNVDAEVAALVEMVGPEPVVKASKTPLGAGGASAVAQGA